MDALRSKGINNIGNKKFISPSTHEPSPKQNFLIDNDIHFHSRNADLCIRQWGSSVWWMCFFVVVQPKKVMSFEDTKQRASQWKKAIEALQNRWNALSDFVQKKKTLFFGCSHIYNCRGIGDPENIRIGCSWGFFFFFFLLLFKESESIVMELALFCFKCPFFFPTLNLPMKNSPNICLGRGLEYEWKCN